MAIKPILFNTEMVRAILDGRKTCTRRLPRKQIEEKYLEYEEWVCAVAPPGSTWLSEKEFYEEYPPYQLGDILYVRETFIQIAAHTFWYYADGKSWMLKDLRWKPSIHMPKEAARIWLKVTNVRVERLQEITEDETFEEGLDFTPPCLHLTGENYCDIDGPCTSKVKYCDMSAGELFGKVLWDSTIKKSDIDRYGWDANPWVWAIEFERCEKPQEVNDND